MRRHPQSSFFLAAGLLTLGLLPFGVHAASSHIQAAPKLESPVTQPHLDHPDTVCRSCHREIYDLYEQTPMARASGLAIDGLDAGELAAKDLIHRNSGVMYHIAVQDRQPYLRYTRPATPQKAALDGQFRLDYFIGSGRRGRTYLYNIDNLWFETPINWYAKTKMWDMAPAYENARAMPDPLPVDSNCLHCHASDVQPALGSTRNRYVAQPFRSAGIGCSACHGDPTEHLRKPSGPTIINPAKLDPIRRESICLQCHLEGDAAVYLPGKSLQAFRPGEDLSKSVTYFIDNTRAQLGLRASSQYEALLRSACRRAAGDRLTCTTCHDPHSSPSPADRVEYFRGRCLVCHTSEKIAASHHPEQRNCAVCHMPTRKTSDISHEQLTDHDIEAVPTTTSLPSLISPRRTANLIPVGSATVSDRELGLAYAQLAQRGDSSSGRKALTLLQQAERSSARDTEVQDQLGFLLQISGSPIVAADHYKKALAQDPLDVTALANLAVIYASTGRTDDAAEALERALRSDPSKTAAGLNLAFLQCTSGQKQKALATVAMLLRYNPDSLPLHNFLTTGVYGGQQCALQ